MIHLPPLPGYTKHPGMYQVIKKALTDLETLEKAGFDGVLVENDNDQPHQIIISLTIRNAFSTVMKHVLQKAKIPVGMEIIYDMQATIEVAHLVKSPFVRLDVFVDDVDTKWGKIQAQSNEIISLKRKLNANDICLLTDIQVKHARMLKKKSLHQSAKEAVRKGSDGIIVTGSWTGIAPDITKCQHVKKVIGKFPVLVGSGLDITNAKELLSIVDGAIVGTSIKTGEYVDLEKAKKLINLINTFRKN